MGGGGSRSKTKWHFHIVCEKLERSSVLCSLDSERPASWPAMGVSISRNVQYKDVYRKTTEILQHTRIFKLIAL